MPSLFSVLLFIGFLIDRSNNVFISGFVIQFAVITAMVMNVVGMLILQRKRLRVVLERGMFIEKDFKFFNWIGFSHSTSILLVVLFESYYFYNSMLKTALILGGVFLIKLGLLFRVRETPYTVKRAVVNKENYIDLGDMIYNYATLRTDCLSYSIFAFIFANYSFF